MSIKVFVNVISVELGDLNGNHHEQLSKKVESKREE